MQFVFDGKVAIVTGAAMGIGEAIKADHDEFRRILAKIAPNLEVVIKKI